MTKVGLYAIDQSTPLEPNKSLDEDIAVAVFRASVLDAHLPMPAVHATHRVWMHRAGEVLVYASIFSPHPVGIWVGTAQGLNALYLS